MFTAEQAEQSTDTTLDSAVTLNVPAGLSQPAKPGKYDIPESNAKLVVSDERSPALVLATASSSRIEEGDKAVRVWFDRNELTGELLPFLQTQVKAQFAEQGLELSADETGLVYTTDWLNRSEQSGFWLWSSEQQLDKARFNITFGPRPHGRSVSVTVSMLEHQYFTPDAKLSSMQIQRQEVALLNQIIDRIAKEEILIARANKAKAPDVSLEPGMDAQGNPALLTLQPIDVTWSQLEVLFTELNLAVTDKNRSSFTYYLTYEKPERSFWSGLWGEDSKPQLPVIDGEYQMVLTRVGTQTAISMRNKEGELLSPETVLAMHEPFVQAIRQARIEL